MSETHQEAEQPEHVNGNYVFEIMSNTEMDIIKYTLFERSGFNNRLSPPVVFRYLRAFIKVHFIVVAAIKIAIYKAFCSFCGFKR